MIPYGILISRDTASFLFCRKHPWNGFDSSGVKRSAEFRHTGQDSPYLVHTHIYTYNNNGQQASRSRSFTIKAPSKEKHCFVWRWRLIKQTDRPRPLMRPYLNLTRPPSPRINISLLSQLTRIYPSTAPLPLSLNGARGGKTLLCRRRSQS